MKMNPRSRTLFGCGLAVTATLLLQPALAATDTAQVEAKFRAADKDSDGKLTLKEAKAGMPRIGKNFTKLDTERRGYLTLEQIQAAAAR